MPRITSLLELAITNAFVSQLFDQELFRRGLRPAQVGSSSSTGTGRPRPQRSRR